LLENGLLFKLETLGGVAGYCSETQILLVLAFMLLCRYRNVEQLQGTSPGEFGKLVGIDRIPEARCLWKKTTELAGESCADEWTNVRLSN